MSEKNVSPLILVPGLWLGGWAWDEVSDHLSGDGVPAQAVTLPGLDSPATPRAGIRLADHIAAVVTAIRAAGEPVVLVAHSGAGMLATAALDEVPGMVRRVVYVDSGPVSDGAVARPELDPETLEVPLPPTAQLAAAGVSLDGLGEEALRRFQDRAIPHPAGPLREPVRLSDPARHQVPATLVCCSFPSTTVREMVGSEVGMFAPLADLADVHYLDLPTGHWPMWSRPAALADLLAEAAHG
ncbi:alpha/beta fold hydrolase [Actinocorallia aurea]